jgi:hypothetical protein
MAFGAPEKGGDLLKTFFPRAVLESIYCIPCPHEPVGFFTGTPFGPVDIVPIEAKVSALTRYRTLTLLGWNTADPGQLERLSKYLEAGGHLVLGLPQLSTCTRRDQEPVPFMVPQARELLGLEVDGLMESSEEFTAVQARDKAYAEAVRGRKLRLGLCCCGRRRCG